MRHALILAFGLPLAACSPEGPPAVDTPLFTIDSLDGRAEIRINGKPVGSTPGSWAGTARSFDSRIRVDAWPPPHAMLATKTSVVGPAGKLETELWIAGAKNADDDRAALHRLYPHVAPGEHVVFVQAGVEGGVVRGAFRLSVEGRRFVLHRPAHVSEESEDFQKWNRSLWFERE
ncbi:MAG TPA: hypothetical protein VF950_03115 [Planctomycetota bacterium]